MYSNYNFKLSSIIFDVFYHRHLDSNLTAKYLIMVLNNKKNLKLKIKENKKLSYIYIKQVVNY